MPAQQPLTLQEILARRQDEEFVGRVLPIRQFMDTFHLPLDDPRRRFVFDVYGPTGVGKTWLLQRWQRLAAEGGALTGWTDEAQQDVPAVMGIFAAQLVEQGGGIPGYRARIRPIVSRITIHWPSFYNVVTGKTLALPNLIALQHIPLSPAGVIAKRPAPIALPNSCAAEWRMAPDAVFSPYASVRYFTPHMVHSQYNLL
jgi:hypothetical protein